MKNANAKESLFNFCFMSVNKWIKDIYLEQVNNLPSSKASHLEYICLFADWCKIWYGSPEP